MRQSRAVVCGMVGLVVGILAAGMVLAQGGNPPAEKPKVDPSNALWEVKLSSVVQDSPLTLLLATADGKVTRAFGLGVNKAVHDVDAAGLAISENSLKGSVKVTVNADQWVPADGKPVECRFDLDAAIKDGNLGGTYKGKRGSDEVAGMIVGTITTPIKEIRNATIKMELERALKGRTDFQRVYMTVTVRDGKVSETKASGKDEFHWKARVKDSKLTVTPEALAGDVTVEVYDALSATEGIYTFTLDGKVVGSKVAGRFKSKLGDEEISESAMFSGGIQ